MEQPHDVVNPWLMYALGYIGLMGRIVWMSLKRGTQLDAMFHYVKKNSLIILSSFISYNAVMAMWMWTDFFAAGGMFRGELNAMTVFVGVGADAIFKKAVEYRKKELLDTFERKVKDEVPGDTPKV